MKEPEEAIKAQKSFRDNEIQSIIREHLKEQNKLSEIDHPDKYIEVASHTMLLYARAFSQFETNMRAEKEIVRQLHDTASQSDSLFFLYKQAKMIGWLEEAGLVNVIMQAFREEVIPVINESYRQQPDSE